MTSSARVDVRRTQVRVSTETTADGLRGVTVEEPAGRHVDVGAQSTDTQVTRTLGSEHFFTKSSGEAEPKGRGEEGLLQQRLCGGKESSRAAQALLLAKL